jgi:4'-phosphopantetheinyl transferase EntD
MILAALSEDLDCVPLRAALAPFGARVGVRRIRAGDEAAFADPRGASLVRRRASGAARIVARRLIEELGFAGAAALARAPTGAPQWPSGLVGSLAHDETFAVAVAAPRNAIAGIGVDVEPAEPLPEDVVDLVLTPEEARETAGDRIERRLIFSAKEAVYKAVHALVGADLDYHDIRVGLEQGTAILADGRRIRLFTLARERLLAVAFSAAD